MRGIDIMNTSHNVSSFVWDKTTPRFLITWITVKLHKYGFTERGGVHVADPHWIHHCYLYSIVQGMGREGKEVVVIFILHIKCNLSMFNNYFKIVQFNQLQHTESQVFIPAWN